ncbi:MAG TPA: PEGA domain-containing protein [Terriglobia bacterium]|nr:PEGA domain-containing protein [Terriglobia bacterium]
MKTKIAKFTVFAGLAVALAAGLQVTVTLVARQDEPLKADEIIGLLHDQVPSTRVAELVKQFGVDFALTPRIESDLRKAGATPALIDVIKGAGPANTAPAADAPAMLKIISKPGEAQVYVNDVPKGMTSPEGELRLPVPSGKYKLRVSLPGFESWENPVSVDAGETQAIYVTLVQKPQGSTPSQPGGSPNPPTTLQMLPVTAVTGSDLRFFESPYEGTPVAQRQYTARFPVQTTRYVNWEIHLSYAKATQDYTFPLDAVWYGPTGAQVAHHAINGMIKKDWTGSRHASGWGCKAPPCKMFSPGTYRVVISSQGTQLIQGTFEIAP